MLLLVMTAYRISYIYTSSNKGQNKNLDQILKANFFVAHFPGVYLKNRTEKSLLIVMDNDCKSVKQEVTEGTFGVGHNLLKLQHSEQNSRVLCLKIRNRKRKKNETLSS